MINDAMFRRNGKAGYVLKPQALREAHKDLLTRRTKHLLKVRVISAQQLPRPRDSQGREIVDKSVMDPYVEVSLLVPDWTQCPFLPSESNAQYTPASEPQAGGATSARVVSTKTKVVKNNGFNPVWEESSSLPFDCVGDMKNLVFLKFTVKEDGQDSDEPLAQYITPLGCLRQGTFSLSRPWCEADYLTLGLPRLSSYSPARLAAVLLPILDLVYSYRNCQHWQQNLIHPCFFFLLSSSSRRRSCSRAMLCFEIVVRCFSRNRSPFPRFNSQRETLVCLFTSFSPRFTFTPHFY